MPRPLSPLTAPRGYGLLKAKGISVYSLPILSERAKDERGKEHHVHGLQVGSLFQKSMRKIRQNFIIILLNHCQSLPFLMSPVVSLRVKPMATGHLLLLTALFSI